MARTSHTGLALGVQGLKPHDPHEPLDALAIGQHPVALQPVPKAPGTQEGMYGPQFLDTRFGGLSALTVTQRVLPASMQEMVFVPANPSFAIRGGRSD